MFAIGDETEADAGAVQQLGHPGIGGTFPRRLGDIAGEVLGGGIDLHEQPGLAGLGLGHDKAGAEELVGFLPVDLQRLGNGLSFEQHLGIEIEHPLQDELHPVALRGRVGTPFVDRQPPVGILLPQQAEQLGIMGIEPLRELLEEDRQGKKAPRDGDEGEPFGVVTGDGHGGNLKRLGVYSRVLSAEYASIRSFGQEVAPETDLSFR